MPDMDGFEVIRRITSDERWADIPVIFITGVTESTSEEKGLDLGAVD
jgi:putative two-component system response regulator